jgi:hypothetical protein
MDEVVFAFSLQVFGRKFLQFLNWTSYHKRRFAQGSGIDA